MGKEILKNDASLNEVNNVGAMPEQNIRKMKHRASEREDNGSMPGDGIYK